MKKYLALICMILCFALTFGIAWADTTTNQPSKITITFKVGSDTLKINGKDVKVQKPYAVNGTTLVPLRVITEAFGAEVNWNAKDNSITLKYGETEIKLVIGSKEAIVNGTKTTLAVAPVSLNGTTMVPLRFITENFGAETNYDAKTQMITVVKEIVGDNSIKDFTQILTKTQKTKVGDSYFGWSMNLPKDLKITYRSFNGKDVDFTALDESYCLLLSVYSLKEGENLDTLLAEGIDALSDFNITDQGIFKTADGAQYAKIAFYDDDGYYEDRLFIKGSNYYFIELQCKDEETYNNSAKAMAILDSFTTSFVKDGTTEDISDVNAAGYRIYESKKLKWSILVPADWSTTKEDNKENIVYYDEPRTSKDKDAYLNQCSVAVNMFSLETDMTLDKWVQQYTDELNKDYNPKLLKIVSSEDVVINGVKAKKITYTMEYNGSLVYYCDILMTGKSYKYMISYNMGEKSYNDFSKKLKVETMLNSFKFSEPNAASVGKLLDSNRLANYSSYRNVEIKEQGFSMQIPVAMIADSDNTKDYMEFYDDKKGISVTVSTMKDNIDFYSLVGGLDTKLSSEIGDSFAIVSQDVVNDKGVPAKRYVTTTKIGNFGNLTDIVYVFVKNGYVYFVSISMPTMNYGENYIEIANKIWQSVNVQ